MAKDGNLPRLSSSAYNPAATHHWWKFEVQVIMRALVLARDRVGKSRLARIAMMAITTNNSMSVKARRLLFVRNCVSEAAPRFEAAPVEHDAFRLWFIRMNRTSP